MEKSKKHIYRIGCKFVSSKYVVTTTITLNQTFKIFIMALEFTDANFQSTVLDSDKLTVVDFWAEWCGPCRAIGPVVEELSKEYNGRVNIGKVNVDQNPTLSVNYGITSIPAILFVKGGKVVDKQIGAVPKSVLDKKIQSHL